jgi:beta-glucosidase
MRQRLGSDLPTFSEKDKEFIRNKIDFVGLNHYTSRLIAHHQNPDDVYFYQVQQMERIGMVLQLSRKDKKKCII